MKAQSSDGSWRVVATASAWQLATRPTEQVAHHADPAVSLPVIEQPNDSLLDDAWRNGFVHALDWHVDSSADLPGNPTMVWVRLSQPLVAGEDVTKLATMAKLKAGRLGRELTDACLQFWGGMGFMNETHVSRAYRDSRLTSIGGGADEVMLSIICKLTGTLSRPGA